VWNDREWHDRCIGVRQLLTSCAIVARIGLGPAALDRSQRSHFETSMAAECGQQGRSGVIA
jgi:hypothetical protein